MGTFDYFCSPSIFGKNAGAGQCSKRLASAAGGLPLYLWEKCRGRAVQQKIGERYRWGATPLSLAKSSAVKNWRALPLGGYPSSLGKMQGQGSAAKIGERYRWGATPLSLGKMQGQGSAVKSWSALLGKCRAGQCSKKLASATAGGYPISLGKCKGRAVQQKIGERCWGATPLSLGKMQGQGSAAKIGERCWGATPLSCRSRAVQ